MRDQMMSDGMARWMDGPFGIPLAPLAIVLVVVALIALVVFVLPNRTPPTPDAREELRRRYARGEIDRAEFDERRRTLDG